MDISVIDRTDDALVEQCWGVCQRSAAASRVAPHRYALEEFAKDLRFTFPGEHDLIAAARESGRVLGLARVWFPERDNTTLCWAELQVDPVDRGRGVGSALLGWLEEAAVAAGRPVLLLDAFARPEERATDRDRRFVESHGFTLANVEVVRHLELPVPPERLEALEDSARSAVGGAYEVQVYLNGVPEELRQSLCDCSNRLALDAPTGEVDFEAESMTPADYAELLEHERGTGANRLTTLAVERGTGVVAAYTDLVLPAGDPEVAHQWGTLVLPEHRGHRLGMAVKVANVRELQRIDPQRKRIDTCNAEQNPWMVQINVDLGFQIVEELLNMKKDL
ncbi:MAG: GNAT family N-acetyltransferase [Intrasporangium sp.]|uniref:GNAT family N-acetyltransferase n=1 Tax=Intrasporangium sp. TaxID=1925024 RepID=UPI002649B629|nr:GNAT family N-acetyltransferase [Intrasporangium sp.]MDN5795813.1 GNAT family N-acetyltransferase [Intrasporangium sp.]